MIYESEISIFNKDALKTKFGSIQTNFDVTLGKISAIISDSEIEEYISGHTTMNSKLSSVVQDLDGVHTQVSSMKTDYDSHFTSVESHLTTLDTTVSGISASVSTVSQEAIKTDTIYYLATSASSGVTRSTSGWTTTTQSVTAEKRYLWIYHKYTKGDDSTTYTDPVIAGVYGDTGASFGWNLVRGTNALANGNGYWSTGTWRTTASGGTVAYNQDIADSPVPSVTKGAVITATSANTSIGIVQDRCPVRKEQITQSVWVKGSAGDKVRLQPIWSDTSGATESGAKDITLADGNWTRIEWSKTPNYAHDSVSLCYVVYLAKTAGTTLTVCCPKIEYGSPASEWCLAEDEVHGTNGTNGKDGADSGNMLLDVYAPSLTKINAKYNRYFSDAGNTSTVCSFVSAEDEVLPDPNAKYFVRIQNTELNKYRGLCFYGSGNNENAIGMIVGETYKVSCWVRQLEGSSNFFIYLDGDGGVSRNDATFVPTAEWEKYEKVFTFNDRLKNNDPWSRIYFGNRAGVDIGGAGTGIGQIDMCGFKLERVNAIAASGRNLCLRTSDYNGWGKNNGTTFNGNIITFPSVTSDTWREAWQSNNVPYSIARNQKVTVTYKVKGTSGQSLNILTSLCLVSGENSTSRLKYRNRYCDIMANGEWQTVAFSAYVKDEMFGSGDGTPDYNSCFLGFHIGALNTNHNGFQVKEVMVALGSDPCAWSPAPEDGIAYTDAVEVGGRNILVNSDSMSNWYKGSRTTISDGVATLTGSDADCGAVFCSSKYDISVYDGSEFIWSFEYKSTADCYIVKNISSTGATVDSTSYARTKYTAWSANETLPSSGGEWKKFILPARTIKLSDLATGSGNTVSGFLQLYNRTTDVVLQVRHMKLEKGNKATDWNPAPEDVSIAEIATLRYASDSTTAPSAPTSAVTSTATTTGVWTKATPILSGTYKYMYMCDQVKWENGLYTWTAVVRDSALEDLVERVTTAELKITDSAIISTVTETVNGKTALNSVIDQRADSIRLKADKISWSSTYSSMTENGTLTASNVELTGKITATSGYIGTSSSGFTISSSAIYNGISSVGATSGTGVYIGTDGMNLGGGKFKVTNAGAVTAKSLTANDYIYVNGSSSSYLKIPFGSNTNYYLEASSSGLKVRSSRNSKYYDVFLSGDTTFGSEIMITSQSYTDFLALGNDYITIGDSLSGVKRAVYTLNGISFVDSYYQNTQCKVKGTLTVTGTKNRLVSTNDYSDRLLYCYETPSPLFGDIGEGEIGEDGKCYVWLDPVFSQTIRTSNYQVSLQSYSPSLTYVMERTDSYFVVGGEPGAKFGWEIKAKQADFAERRLDRFEEQREDDSVNYGLLASNHINELMEGRYAE